MNKRTLRSIHYKEDFLITKVKQLTQIIRNNSPDKFFISRHAMERYKERFHTNICIKDLRDKIITPDFLERLDLAKSNDTIKILHPNINNCICVIRGNTLLTVCNIFNYEREIEKAKKYLMYYINTIAKNEIPLSSEQFDIAGYNARLKKGHFKQFNDDRK